MIVHNKEHGFLFSVGASAELAKFCPDEDISKIGDILNEGYAQTTLTMAKIIEALSRGYENSKKFTEPGYVPDVLTAEEVLTLSPDEFSIVVSAALDAYNGDTKTEIELKQAKKNTKAEP